MCTPTQLDHDLFRILLYRKDESEILLETTWEGFRLPVLSVPAHRRTAEEVTAAIRNAWNLETYCLFPLSGSARPQSLVRDQAVEACYPSCGCPAGMEWLPVVSLSEGVFQSPSDFTAVENSLRTFEQYRRDELPGFFGKPGWLRVVTKWVEAQAVAAGLCLTSKFRQLNASPAFSLLRFETDGRALWFKAVGEPNLPEYSITLKLAAEFPEFVPHILGSRPEWNAWLSLEAEGSELDASSPAHVWEIAAENLALLQIASLSRRFELIEAGCKDLRLWALRAMVDPFFDSMTHVMGRQTKLSPAPLSRHELLSLGRKIKSTLEELEADGLPNTLGHVDMNPGNVVASDTRCVFLDWAQAYVGPPLFSFQYLLQHWRQRYPADQVSEASFVSRYARLWRPFATSEQIAISSELAPLLATFAYAVGGATWQKTENITSETASYLRSLVRRMKGEADMLSKGNFTCTP
jgi:Ser/Thr protein kinase RdoA (MazF antagonist)